MDLGALVQNLGFPVAIAVYFIWRDYQTSKEHKADLKEIANKAVQSIDKSTDAINDSIEAIGKNSHILERVNGVLLARRETQDDRGVN